MKFVLLTSALNKIHVQPFTAFFYFYRLYFHFLVKRCDEPFGCSFVHFFFQLSPCTECATQCSTMAKIEFCIMCLQSRLLYFLFSIVDFHFLSLSVKRNAVSNFQLILLIFRLHIIFFSMQYNINSLHSCYWSRLNEVKFMFQFLFFSYKREKYYSTSSQSISWLKNDRK